MWKDEIWSYLNKLWKLYTVHTQNNVTRKSQNLVQTLKHIYTSIYRFFFFLENIDIADTGQEVTKTAPAMSKSVPPNELCHVSGEQIVWSTKLALHFPFRSHPCIFNVLGVNIWIVGIHKMPFVHDNIMRVNSTTNLWNVSIGRPPIRHDVRSGKDKLLNNRFKSRSGAIWYLHHETPARFYLNISKNPVSPSPGFASVVFSVKKQGLVDLNSQLLTVVTKPTNLLRISIDELLADIAHKVRPINHSWPAIHTHPQLEHDLILGEICTPHVHEFKEFPQRKFTPAKKRIISHTDRKVVRVAPPAVTIGTLGVPVEWGWCITSCACSTVHD